MQTNLLQQSEASPVREAVFNFHDVILIMTAMQCCFFAILILITNKNQTKSDYYLAAFAFVLAFIPIHELILWGYEFKIKVRDTFPNTYFSTGFAYYIDSVLLFFYIKSLTYKEVKLKKTDTLHLAPLIVFVTYMSIFFYALPYAERLEIIKNESFAYSWPYISMDLFCKALRVCYCIYCFIFIKQYNNQLKSSYSNIEPASMLWLKLLVTGFLCVTSIELSLSLAKFWGILTTPNYFLFEMLGLSGYYALFAVVNLLVFASIRCFSSFEQVKRREQVQLSAEDLEVCTEYAEKVDTLMKQEKYYLSPSITLEGLAEQMEILAKDLSTTINRHYKKNFYEFINHYRIDEAKQRLQDPKNNSKTITEIYLEIGFNSKSVFNTFFKKVVGMTPSQYRKSKQIT